MKTAQQVKDSFLTELKQLLAKYNAELQIQDKGRNYPEPYIDLSIPSVYGGEKGYDCLQEYVDADLGTWLHKDSNFK